MVYIRHLFRVAITIVVWTISVFILIGVTEVVGSSTVSSFLLFLVTTRTGPRTNSVRDGLRTGPYGAPYGGPYGMDPVRARTGLVRTEWTPYGPVRSWSVQNGLRTESVRAKMYPYGIIIRMQLQKTCLESLRACMLAARASNVTSLARLADSARRQRRAASL